jgi:hypothetical protein
MFRAELHLFDALCQCFTSSHETPTLLAVELDSLSSELWTICAAAITQQDCVKTQR